MPTCVTGPSAKSVAVRIAEEIATAGWSVHDGFVSATDVRRLAAEADRRFGAGEFRPAGVGARGSTRVVAEVRRDEILWLDLHNGGAVQRRLARSMEVLRLALNESLCLGLFDLDVHFSVYEPGAFYGTHHDRSRIGVQRTVTCVLYLNEVWNTEDGGQLRLFLEAPDVEPWIDVEPLGGRLVCFLSERFYHAVLPAARRRLALSGWFGRRH